MVINPKTGAIEAMYSNPTFDPDRIGLTNAKAAEAY